MLHYGKVCNLCEVAGDVAGDIVVAGADIDVVLISDGADVDVVLADHEQQQDLVVALGVAHDQQEQEQQEEQQQDVELLHQVGIVTTYTYTGDDIDESFIKIIDSVTSMEGSLLKFGDYFGVNPTKRTPSKLKKANEEIIYDNAVIYTLYGTESVFVFWKLPDEDKIIEEKLTNKNFDDLIKLKNPYVLFSKGVDVRGKKDKGNSYLILQLHNI
jgi:hypothetical protein